MRADATSSATEPRVAAATEENFFSSALFPQSE
jgi:hypothetical protein